MSTYRPITFTPYDPAIHKSVSKTVFTGFKFAQDGVDYTLLGMPAPSMFVLWGSPDLSFSVSITKSSSDGDDVHKIGLATGELYAMARDGLFFNSSESYDASFRDHLFADINETSRIYEVRVDNIGLHQEVIYGFSISGNELFNGDTPSAQELEAFAIDLETNGSYVPSDIQFATPSEADLATTSPVTDMPTNNYEWADEYYDYLWNPLDDDRVTNGSVNLTVSAKELLDGKTWGVVLPSYLRPDGSSELGPNMKADFWVDTNTDDLFIQILTDDSVVFGYH